MKTLQASFDHERLIHQHQVDPGFPHYTRCIAYQIPFPLDATLLESAMHDAAMRHEILRTTFSCPDGCPVQTIWTGSPPVVRRITLTASGDLERATEARQHVADTVASLVDIEELPLQRLLLYEISQWNQFLVYLHHPMLMDHISTNRVFEEMVRYYLAALHGSPPVFSRPATQYADFALWQRKTITEHLTEEAVNFFKDYLGSKKTYVEFPSIGASNNEFRDKIIRAVIQAAAYHDFKQISAECRVTPAVLFLSLFARTLCKVCGSEDVVVGLLMSTRTQSATRETAGFFSNSIPIRIAPRRDEPLFELVSRVREHFVQIMKYSHIPFVKILEGLPKTLYGGRSPAFNLQFNFESSLGSSSLDISSGVRFVDFERTHSAYDFSLTVTETPNEFKLSLVYNAAWISENTAQIILDDILLAIGIR